MYAFEGEEVGVAGSQMVQLQVLGRYEFDDLRSQTTVDHAHVSPRTSSLDTLSF